MGWLTASFEMPAMALACQAPNRGWSFMPAAVRNAVQSRPGAFFVSSDRSHTVLPLATSNGLGHRDVRPGDRHLQRHHAFCPRLRFREARQPQHVGDVRLVLGAQLRIARVRAQVVFLVGHAEAPLQQVGPVLGRVIQVLGDPQTHDVGRVEVAQAVQHIHVGPHRAAQGSRQILAGLDGGDRVQFGLQRARAQLLHPRLVHEGREIVADLARVRALGRVRLRRLLDDPADARRCLLSITAKLPRLERSGGISVVSTHLPTA